MPAILPTPQNPLLFFISKFLVLAGLVVVMMGFATLLAFALCIPVFGINYFTEPSLFLDYKTNDQVLHSLKFIQSLYAIGVFFVPAWLFPRYMQAPRTGFLSADNVSKPIFWLAAIVLYIVSVPLISYLVSWNESIQLPESLMHVELRLKASEQAAKELTLAFTSGSGLGVLMINMLVVAILPAVCEEFLFRGALMKFLLHFARHPHNAVFLSAFIFSAFHGQFYGFFPRLAIGIVLGYVVYFSGSIWPAVLLHFINNGIALLAAHYQWNQSGIEWLSDSYTVSGWLAVVSLFATLVLVFYLYRMHRKAVWYNGE